MPTDKQRRAAERRRLQRQLERRRQRAERRKRFVLIASVVGVVLVVGLVIGLLVATSGDDSPAASPPTRTATAAPSPSSSSSAALQAAYPCSWTKEGAAARKGITVPSTTRPPRTGTVAVAVATNRGPIRLALDRAKAPCAVASFVSLARQKYYDGSPCHRLTTSGIYVLQCGDPTGTGMGTPGYSIPDEATGKESYPAGTVAMARTQQPHSGGSQFFVVYRNSPNLQQMLGRLQYTIFGKVSSGLGVVTDVAAGGATGGSDGKPKLPLTLRTVTAAR